MKEIIFFIIMVTFILRIDFTDAQMQAVGRPLGKSLDRLRDRAPYRPRGRQLGRPMPVGRQPVTPLARPIGRPPERPIGRPRYGPMARPIDRPRYGPMARPMDRPRYGPMVKPPEGPLNRPLGLGRALDRPRYRPRDRQLNKYDRRIWVATPAAFAGRRFYTLPPDMPDDFNSSELEQAKQPEQNVTSSKPRGWASFWMSMMMMFEGMAGLTPAGTEEQTIRACYIIATTYMSALNDLRRYFSMKYFYENNLEYEVGYIVNEIITKYQRMLEIFHIAQIRYYEHQNRNFAPSSYMLYLYSNVLEMGTVIAHMCNMLHELEERFKDSGHAVPNSGFSDYHLPKIKASSGPNGTGEFEKAINAYERRLAAERKRREKLRIKLRKKNLYGGFTPTTPSRKQKGYWPINYGWSIEYW